MFTIECHNWKLIVRVCERCMRADVLMDVQLEGSRGSAIGQSVIVRVCEQGMRVVVLCSDT